MVVSSPFFYLLADSLRMAIFLPQFCHSGKLWFRSSVSNSKSPSDHAPFYGFPFPCRHVPFLRVRSKLPLPLHGCMPVFSFSPPWRTFLIFIPLPLSIMVLVFFSRSPQTFVTLSLPCCFMNPFSLNYKLERSLLRSCAPRRFFFFFFEALHRSLELPLQHIILVATLLLPVPPISHPSRH